MTDDLRERVARAIAQLIQDLPYEELPEHGKLVSPRALWSKSDMLEIADAALAIPEPGDLLPNGDWVAPGEATDAMLIAGHKSRDFRLLATYQAMRAASIGEREKEKC